jgi:hypothetical protein
MVQRGEAGLSPTGMDQDDSLAHRGWKAASAMNRSQEEFRENLQRNGWPMGEPTVIDAIARLSRFHSIAELGEWAEALPNEIKTDDRFAKGVKRRLAEINGKT